VRLEVVDVVGQFRGSLRATTVSIKVVIFSTLALIACYTQGTSTSTPPGFGEQA
jgi:hypothetical protein